ncbi:MAG: hypothetical protein ACE1ZE_05525, partial [Candidatus Binatia bacterium]
VTGNGNGRVEVFKLNEDGTLARPTADHILGKPSEYARRSHANPRVVLRATYFMEKSVVTKA